VADAIERRVIEIIARKKNLNAGDITPDSTFNQLGIDSLDAADLLFTFEEAFNIVVPDEAAASMRSVREIADGIRQLTAARAGTE
jgi:acyl carrier protein